MTEFLIKDEDLSSLKGKVVVLTGTANLPLLCRITLVIILELGC